MPQQSDERLCLARVIRTKPKDVIARNRKRRGGAALTDHQDTVRVCERLDRSNFRARLWSDDNLNAAAVEVSDSVDSLRWNELRVPNEQAKALLAVRRGFNLIGGDLKRGNGVFPESRPRSG